MGVRVHKQKPRGPDVTPKRRARSARPKGLRPEDWKAELSRETDRENLRRAVEETRETEAAARAQRELELTHTREVCGRARERLQESCASRRTRSRTKAHKRIDAAKLARKQAREDYRRAREMATGRKKKKRRRRIEALTESDDAVRHEIAAVDAGLLPVWERIKGSIKGSRHRSRTEAFFEWVEENPYDVLDLRESMLEDESYAAEQAAYWAAQAS